MTEPGGGDRVGRRPQYDGYAAAYAQSVVQNPYNARIERPAFLDLIGEVTGQRAVDAACGSGRYTGDLVERGATVVGFDQSEDNIALARRTVPAAEFRVHDVADPLDWLPDATFDLALLAMAYHYLDDRVAALRELHRVLRPGGTLVLSTRHPLSWFYDYGGSYFDAGVVEEEWDDGWRLRWWRQPLEHTMADIAAAGFTVERLVEPRPPAELAAEAPEVYERTATSPLFLMLRLRA